MHVKREIIIFIILYLHVSVTINQLQRIVNMQMC